MKKLLSFLLICFLCATGFAQDKIAPSDSFVIHGRIEKKVTFSDADLAGYTAVAIGDITTVNHQGEVKTTRKAVKGILLKDVLSKLKLDAAKHKDLESYYFILTASDGYKVVLSYNEVFHHNTVYIITESNGQPWSKIEDRIAVLTLIEPHKGLIALKGLTKLTVEKVL